MLASLETWPPSLPTSLDSLQLPEGEGERERHTHMYSGQGELHSSSGLWWNWTAEPPQHRVQFVWTHTEVKGGGRVNHRL